MDHVVDPVVYISGFDSNGDSIYIYYPIPTISPASSDFNNITRWFVRDDVRVDEWENQLRCRVAYPHMPPWKDDLVVLYPKEIMVSSETNPTPNPVAVAIRFLTPMIRHGQRSIVSGKIRDETLPAEYETGYRSIMISADWVGAIGTSVNSPEEHAAYMGTFPRVFDSPEDGPQNFVDYELEGTEREDWSTYDELSFDTTPDTESNSTGLYAAERGWRFSPKETETQFLRTWTVESVDVPVPPLIRYRYKYRVVTESSTLHTGNAVVSGKYGGGSLPIIIMYPKQTKTIDFTVNIHGGQHGGTLSGMVIEFYNVRPELDNPTQTLDSSVKHTIGTIPFASLASINAPVPFTFSFTPDVVIDPKSGLGYTAICWRSQCADDSFFFADSVNSDESGVFVKDAAGDTLPNAPAPFGSYV